MKLVVLDFFKDIAYIYTMSTKPLDGDMDSVLIDLGHRPSNCQWMLTKNEIIIKWMKLPLAAVAVTKTVL